MDETAAKSLGPAEQDASSLVFASDICFGAGVADYMGRGISTGAFYPGNGILYDLGKSNLASGQLIYPPCGWIVPAVTS